MDRLVASLFLGAAVVHCQQTVGTQYGPVEGLNNDYAYYWRGVPFAAPPMGDLRWKAPQPPITWTNPVNTKTWAAACPQKCPAPPLICPQVFSEDCLYLNVFTPIGILSLGRLAPVLVFFHGGAFQVGSGGVMFYDASLLANVTATVVVTVNYRLGALGYLHVPGSDDLTGNYGFLDQQFALAWVQNNIVNFGGDPRNVTISGHSTGAISVAAHLTAPTSWRYFNSAVLESSPFGLMLNDPSLDQFAVQQFTSAAGCSNGNATCLRALSVVAVLDAQLSADPYNGQQPLSILMPWTPLVDGKLLPTQPLLALRAGRVRPNVTITVGTVTNETLLFIHMAAPNALPLSAVYVGLLTLFGNNVTARIMALYGMSGWNCSDCRRQLSVVADDYLMKCPLRYALTGINASTSYVYRFDHVISFPKVVWSDAFRSCWDAVCHGSELAFVFGAPVLYQTVLKSNETDGERTLTAELMADWGRIANSGRPSFPPYGPSRSVWRYGTAADRAGPSGPAPPRGFQVLRLLGHGRIPAWL